MLILLFFFLFFCVIFFHLTFFELFSNRFFSLFRRQAKGRRRCRLRAWAWGRSRFLYFFSMSSFGYFVMVVDTLGLLMAMVIICVAVMLNRNGHLMVERINMGLNHHSTLVQIRNMAFAISYRLYATILLYLARVGIYSNCVVLTDRLLDCDRSLNLTPCKSRLDIHLTARISSNRITRVRHRNLLLNRHVATCMLLIVMSIMIVYWFL